MPEVRHWCRSGRLELVESPMAEGLLRDFDTLAGIDAWHIEDDGIVRGIASRVQVGDNDWRTFTVRSRRANGEKTEFEKRMKAYKGMASRRHIPSAYHSRLRAGL
jgi:hypothetical protein